jgi:hypothetical protein
MPVRYMKDSILGEKMWRLSSLEKAFGPPIDYEQSALDEAIRQAPPEILNPLYEAVVRVYGPPPSPGPNRIDLAELWPELTPVEAEAVEALVALADNLLDEEHA